MSGSYSRFWLPAPEFSSPMLDHFINGQWVRGQGETFSSLNPATGKQVLQTRNADASEVIAAFQAGKTAFQKWAGSPPPERFQDARKFAALVDAHRQSFGTAISS